MLFGGISIYLQQHLALFRKTPRFLDRLWDSPRVIRAFASRSISTDPKLLGDLTISMLEGRSRRAPQGIRQAARMAGGEPVPDVINLPNSLLIGLARPLARRAAAAGLLHAAGRGSLSRRARSNRIASRALELIRRQVAGRGSLHRRQRYYVPVMSTLLGIPADRIAVVPLGINLGGYEPRRLAAMRAAMFRIGYFARVAPEKGLHVLAEAYALFRRRTRRPRRVRLEAAGYLSRAHEPYLEEVRRSLEHAGLGARIHLSRRGRS